MRSAKVFRVKEVGSTLPWARLNLGYTKVDALKLPLIIVTDCLDAGLKQSSIHRRSLWTKMTSGQHLGLKMCIPFLADVRVVDRVTMRADSGKIK